MPTANGTTGFNSNGRVLQLLLVCAAILPLFASTGCRSTRDNQIDILEHELRAQEDYIYELEDYVVEYSDKLRQCRCSQPHVASVTKPTPAMKQSSRSSKKNTIVEKKTPLRTLQEPREDSILDSVEPAAEEPTPIEELEVPELDLEIGEPIGSGEELEDALLADSVNDEYKQNVESVSIPDPAAYQTTGYDESEDAASFPFQEESIESLEETETVVEEETPGPSNRKAERLVIAHVFRDSTGSVEPSSLLSVVEARDSRNEPADFDGKVSLMVMQGDPEAPARIKRWDFTEEETAAAWQTSQFGDGLHLELPLEDTQLPEGPFELWVRLEAADGSKLLAQVPMESQTLASMEDADLEQLAVDTTEAELVESEEVEVATINPLRSGSKSQVRSTPLASANSAAKVEPQWRAATHFSTGKNSGFATTATEEKWNTSTTPIPRDSQPASSTAGKQRWTSRR